MFSLRFKLVSLLYTLLSVLLLWLSRSQSSIFWSRLELIHCFAGLDSNILVGMRFAVPDVRPSMGMSSETTLRAWVQSFYKLLASLARLYSQIVLGAVSAIHL